MNTIRVWILRISALAAIVAGGMLLYDSYQDLTWGRRAMAEAGVSAYRSGLIQERIVMESAEKNKSGAASANAGLLLIVGGLIMEGLSSVIKRIGALDTPRMSA